jgi:hypothetical protein
MSVELVNEVGVDSQIPDQRMSLGEAEGLLFGLFPYETLKIFKAMGPGSERLGAGAVDRTSRVLPDEAAQRHD